MTAINFDTQTHRGITTTLAQPLDEHGAGDSCRSVRSSGSPDRKSETVYTFEALRKRDTTTAVGTEPEAPSATDKILIGRNELQKAFIMVLLAGQVGAMIAWIYLLVKILTMKQTFAWITLLQPFGSWYQYEDCSSSPELCPVSKDVAVPYVPVVGILLGVIQILHMVVFLAWTDCQKAFLFYMKETAFLQTLFMMLQGVISGEGFYKGLMELEGRMRVEIMESANVASDRWILTQMENHCCGLSGTSDWTTHNRTVPKSCYMTQSCENIQTSLCVFWPRGCYNVEEQVIIKFLKIFGAALACGTVFSVLSYLLARRLVQMKKRGQEFDQTQTHRILIRQGSKCTAFGGKGKYHHVIRKDGILIEVSGALASSTGVNENVVSMEIQNYSRADKVNTCMESDRIVVTVTKHGIVRGKAVITAQNEFDLKNIQVLPTQFGIMIAVKDGSEAMTESLVPSS